jgi:hypothetical protein
MATGPQTRALRKDQIERLEKFRRIPHDGSPAGYSYPQLRLTLGSPCTWKTVKKALEGLPIAILIHARISEWIERYLPPLPLPQDWKALAAGMDRTDEADEPKTGIEKTPGTTIPFPGRDSKGEK